METPVKKILMNQVHNLENNDTVTGSEINDIPKVDTSLLKVIEIDKVDFLPFSSLVNVLIQFKNASKLGSG